MNKIYQQKMERYSEEYVFENCERKREVPLVKDAYQNGWHNALQNQWISVDEALPESIAQRVLIVNHHFPFDVYFGRYEYGKWIIEGKSENLWITHWAEIPSLKGGEK